MERWARYGYLFCAGLLILTSVVAFADGTSLSEHDAVFWGTVTVYMLAALPDLLPLAHLRSVYLFVNVAALVHAVVQARYGSVAFLALLTPWFAYYVHSARGLPSAREAKRLIAEGADPDEQHLQTRFAESVRESIVDADVDVHGSGPIEAATRAALRNVVELARDLVGSAGQHQPLRERAGAILLDVERRTARRRVAAVHLDLPLASRGVDVDGGGVDARARGNESDERMSERLHDSFGIERADSACKEKPTPLGCLYKATLARARSARRHPVPTK